MYKYLLTLSLILILSGLSYAQITLSGKVTDSLDRPVSGTTVKLTEKNISTITNSQGAFIFSNLAEGTYNLNVSSIGYDTKRVAVSLSSAQNSFSIILSERITQLQSVEIIGRKEQKYKNTSSFSGTKTETPLKYVPQAISYVTKEVIDDQMAFKTSDVIKNISGAS
ncbi:MAG: DUF2012 domain-containing protein, partial [Bacteroidota bacterium]